VSDAAVRTAAGPATGGQVYRIVWSPGSDRLHGTCHCGAEQVAEDPVRMWEWLLAHPDHDAAGREAPW
jgi:hypothetical protein